MTPAIAPSIAQDCATVKSLELSIGIVLPAPGSCPVIPMARIAIKGTPRRVQRVIAHVEALEQALASNQQASITAR